MMNDAADIEDRLNAHVEALLFNPIIHLILKSVTKNSSYSNTCFPAGHTGVKGHKGIMGRYGKMGPCGIKGRNKKTEEHAFKIVFWDALPYFPCTLTMFPHSGLKGDMGDPGPMGLNGDPGTTFICLEKHSRSS